MKFYCIADEDTVRGFRLAGVSGKAVNSAAATVEAIARAAQSDYGVLILTETVADIIRPLADEIRFERERPLIVEIPGPEGKLAERKDLRQLVQEAVGIHLEAEEGA